MRHFLPIVLLTASAAALAAPATVKHAIDRQETPNQAAESLIVPFAFSTETMGLNLGVGVMANGYYQEQMTVGATAFGGDVSQGFGIGLWNYQVPGTERLHFSLYGMAGYYPDQRAYGNPVKEFHPAPLPGNNDSSAKDYIEANGSSNWWEMKLEYSLPIGATAERAVLHYQTRNGQLISEASGGEN